MKDEEKKQTSDGEKPWFDKSEDEKAWYEQDYSLSEGDGSFFASQNASQKKDGDRVETSDFSGAFDDDNDEDDDSAIDRDDNADYTAVENDDEDDKNDGKDAPYEETDTVYETIVGKEDGDGGESESEKIAAYEEIFGKEYWKGGETANNAESNGGDADGEGGEENATEEIFLPDGVRRKSKRIKDEWDYIVAHERTIEPQVRYADEREFREGKIGASVRKKRALIISLLFIPAMTAVFAFAAAGAFRLAAYLFVLYVLLAICAAYIKPKKQPPLQKTGHFEILSPFAIGFIPDDKERRVLSSVPSDGAAGEAAGEAADESRTECRWRILLRCEKDNEEKTFYTYVSYSESQCDRIVKIFLKGDLVAVGHCNSAIGGYAIVCEPSFSDGELIPLSYRNDIPRQGLD